MSFHRCGDTPGCGANRRSDCKYLLFFFVEPHSTPPLKLQHFGVSYCGCCGGCLVRMLVLTAVWEQSAAGHTALTTQCAGNGLSMFFICPHFTRPSNGRKEKKNVSLCVETVFFFNLRPECLRHCQVHLKAAWRPD